MGSCDLIAHGRSGRQAASIHVSVLKTSYAGQADDLRRVRGLCLDSAAFRSIADRGVDALGVVVVDLLSKQPSEVVLAEDDHVIEQLPSHASHEAFGSPILPGALESCPSRVNSESR